MTFDLTRLFADVICELSNAREKHPRDKAIPFTDMTPVSAERNLAHYRRLVDFGALIGRDNHTHVIECELAEAIAETDPVKRRAELVQVLVTVIRAVADLESEMP